MIEKPCYLVKDVDDIVRMAGSDTEYRIVAIEDGIAWVKHTNTGQSNLEPIEKLIFVRGGGQERDFTDVMAYAMSANSLLDDIEFVPGTFMYGSERVDPAFARLPEVLYTDAGSGFVSSGFVSNGFGEPFDFDGDDGVTGD